LPNIKQYLDETEGTVIQSIWDDLPPVNPVAKELLGYATQKPEALLERIINASSDENSIVADFFCGSGTAAAVAEKLGRRWIACDLGRFAIHTTRKRMLDIPDCKPFEVLNLGKYERAYWQGVTFGETPTEPNQVAIAAYIAFILELYKAQGLAGSHIHGKKGRALIHVGAVDAPVTINEVNEALAECATLGQKELHILGWEWEMGMNDPIIKHAQAEYGIGLRLLNIPREVMEKRAVECGDIRFFDLAFLEAEVKPEGKGKRTIQIELKNFVIPDTDLIPDEIRAKITKWSDYIDYWAVDWDFRHDTFMNQWQTYRTRTQRKLDLISASHTYKTPGVQSILIKVVDIFGNDTNRLLEWEVK
jgi:SAM-dependent methyltransferase